MENIVELREFYEQRAPWTLNVTFRILIPDVFPMTLSDISSLLAQCTENAFNVSQDPRGLGNMRVDNRILGVSWLFTMHSCYLVSSFAVL